MRFAKIEIYLKQRKYNASSNRKCNKTVTDRLKNVSMVNNVVSCFTYRLPMRVEWKQFTYD